MSKLFADNAATTLASQANSGSLSISVTDGSLFPSPVNTDYFTITLTQATTETSWETVNVRSRSTNTLTLETALVNTWASGSKVEIRWTASDAEQSANLPTGKILASSLFMP